jgi:putative membrane protein
MQRFALRLLATALAVLLATLLFSGSLAVAHIGGAIAFALAIGLVNAFLRPVLLLFALPLTLLTLGLCALVVNALGFWTATLVPVGLQVDGFAGTFLGALTVSTVSFLSSRALR